MFLQMWSTITGMECDFESYRPEIYHEEAFKKTVLCSRTAIPRWMERQ